MVETLLVIGAVGVVWGSEVWSECWCQLWWWGIVVVGWGIVVQVNIFAVYGELRPPPYVSMNPF